MGQEADQTVVLHHGYPVDVLVEHERRHSGQRLIGSDTQHLRGHQAAHRLPRRRGRREAMRCPSRAEDNGSGGPAAAPVRSAGRRPDRPESTKPSAISRAASASVSAVIATLEREVDRMSARRQGIQTVWTKSRTWAGGREATVPRAGSTAVRFIRCHIGHL